MSNPLVLVNHHTPKVGLGVALLAALRHQNDVWEAQGLPGFEIWGPYDGPHNACTTVQRWSSFEEWERTRETLPQIPDCRSAVFEHIYPNSLTHYYTHYYADLSGR